MYHGANTEHECGLAASIENVSDTLREILAGVACTVTERDYADLLGYCKSVIDDALADLPETLRSVDENKLRFRAYRWGDEKARTKLNALAELERRAAMSEYDRCRAAAMQDRLA